MTAEHRCVGCDLTCGSPDVLILLTVARMLLLFMLATCTLRCCVRHSAACALGVFGRWQVSVPRATCHARGLQ